MLWRFETWRHQAVSLSTFGLLDCWSFLSLPSVAFKVCLSGVWSSHADVREFREFCSLSFLVQVMKRVPGCSSLPCPASCRVRRRRLLRRGWQRPPDIRHQAVHEQAHPAKDQKATIAEHYQQDFVMSSPCSGTAMAECVHHLVSREVGGDSNAAFSCEKAKSKRDFIQQVVHPMMDAGGCLFEDLMDLAKRVAKCSIHKQNMKVAERVDHFACGFLSGRLAPFRPICSQLGLSVPGLAQWPSRFPGGTGLRQVVSSCF